MRDLHADLVECLGLLDAAKERIKSARLVGRNTAISTAYAAAADVIDTHRDELLGVVEDAELWRRWCDEAQKRGRELAWILDDAKHMGAGVFEHHLMGDTAIDAARHGRGE